MFELITKKWNDWCFKPRFCTVRQYWAGDNLGKWDEFCFESCPWRRINRSTWWPVVQCNNKEERCCVTQLSLLAYFGHTFSWFMTQHRFQVLCVLIDSQLFTFVSLVCCKYRFMWLWYSSEKGNSFNLCCICIEKGNSCNFILHMYVFFKSWLGIWICITIFVHFVSILIVYYLVGGFFSSFYLHVYIL